MFTSFNQQFQKTRNLNQYINQPWPQCSNQQMCRNQLPQQTGLFSSTGNFSNSFSYSPQQCKFPSTSFGYSVNQNPDREGLKYTQSNTNIYGFSNGCNAINHLAKYPPPFCGGGIQNPQVQITQAYKPSFITTFGYRRGVPVQRTDLIHNIAGMPQYQNTSFEEVRYNNYLAKKPILQKSYTQTNQPSQAFNFFVPPKKPTIQTSLKPMKFTNHNFVPPINLVQNKGPAVNFSCPPQHHPVTVSIAKPNPVTRLVSTPMQNNTSYIQPKCIPPAKIDLNPIYHSAFVSIQDIPVLETDLENLLQNSKKNSACVAVPDRPGPMLKYCFKSRCLERSHRYDKSLFKSFDLDLKCIDACRKRLSSKKIPMNFRESKKRKKNKPLRKVQPPEYPENKYLNKIKLLYKLFHPRHFERSKVIEAIREMFGWVKQVDSLEKFPELSKAEIEFLKRKRAPLVRIDFATQHLGIINTRPDYYILPENLEIYYDVINDTCIVPNFTIGRRNYGNVFFEEPLDVAGINIDKEVHFYLKEVVIYPDLDKKPPVGEGLNRPAQVTIDNVWPVDSFTNKSITDLDDVNAINFKGILERICSKNQVVFVDYCTETGSWVFKVPHF